MNRRILGTGTIYAQRLMFFDNLIGGMGGPLAALAS